VHGRVQRRLGPLAGSGRRLVVGGLRSCSCGGETLSGSGERERERKSRDDERRGRAAVVQAHSEL